MYWFSADPRCDGETGDRTCTGSQPIHDVMERQETEHVLALS